MLVVCKPFRWANTGQHSMLLEIRAGMSIKISKSLIYRIKQRIILSLGHIFGPTFLLKTASIRPLSLSLHFCHIFLQHPAFYFFFERMLTLKQTPCTLFLNRYNSIFTTKKPIEKRNKILLRN